MVSKVVTCTGKVCQECIGVLTDCSGDTEEVACDDGNDCTVNDIEVMACNGEICVPCQGTPATCDDGIVFVQPCNDLDPCTINDEITVDCQGDVCIPCAGTPNPTAEPIIPTIENTCFGESAVISVEVTPEQVAIDGNDFICESETTTLTTNLPFDSYSWNTGDVTQSITVDQEGVYEVTVSDSNGCTSTDEFILTVAFNPFVQSGGDNFCEGGFVELSIGSGFSNIEWLPGGETTESITVDEPGVYSVTVQDGTCEGMAIITVVENQIPTPMIDAPAGICPGELASLDATNPNYTNYIWSNGSVNSSILTDTPGTYAVTITDINGCTASTSVDMDFLTPPDADITGIDQLCPDPGSTLDLTANDGVNLSYQWSTGDETQTITVNQAGTYTLTVTDDNNCSTTATANIGNHSSPDVIISGSQSFCTDGTTTIDAGDFVSYSWAPNNENTRTIEVSQEGTYTVTVTDTNGCTGTSATMIQELTELLPIIAGPTQVCPGESSTLFIGGTFDMYNWSTGDMGTNTITVEPGMSYSVTVTDASGCTGSSTVSVSN